jgi:hypothetical protein
MRRPLLFATIVSTGLAALAACQPAPPPEAPVEAPAPDPSFKPGLELELDGNVVRLNDWTAPEALAFTMFCNLDSPIITLSAARSQYPAQMAATKASLVVSGESFPDEVLIQDPGPDATVSLVVDITPALLKALSGATTARLAVDEPNASFAETAVDEGDIFERFAARCGELSKVKIAP